MNKDIIFFHFKKVVKMGGYALVVFIFVGFLEVIHIDIKNNSYISSVTNEKIPSGFVVKDDSKNVRFIGQEHRELVKNSPFFQKHEQLYQSIDKSEFVFSFVQYVKNLFHYSFKKSYSSEVYQADFFMRILVSGLFFIWLIYRYLLRAKFEILPVRFNLYNQIGEQNAQSKKVYDIFLKKSDNQIIYKNASKINYDNYVKSLEDIKQFLGMENLEVQRFKKASVALVVSKIPSSVKFDVSKLKKGLIYMGVDKYLKDFYLSIKNMTHTIVVAETGAGKSVFVQNFLVSLFFNHEEIEQFYLIDPKKAEFGRYQKLKKVVYVENDTDILETLKTLQSVMYQRYESMKRDDLDNGDVIYGGKFIILVMDEFGTLGTIADTKMKNEVERILIDLAQKSRRAKIRMVFIGQKATRESISSNVLANLSSRGVMKTEDGDNIIKMVGNKEELEERGVNPKKFCKGRLYFKDGASGVNTLIQSPFFNLSDKTHIEYLKTIVKDLIPSKNETIKQPLSDASIKSVKSADFYEKNLKNLWERVKNIQDQSKATELRKEIQRCKRDLKRQKMDDLDIRIETLHKQLAH